MGASRQARNGQDAGTGSSPSTVKVFGIGLERTGTTSLTEALKILGYSAVHYPQDDLTRNEIYEYFTAEKHSLRLSLLRDHDAITDTPVCCVYPGLDRAYPGSKFILTVRDKDSWLRSRQRLAEQRIFPQFEQLPSDHPANVYVNFIGRKLYGPYRYDAGMAYDAYHAEVASYFRDRPQDLLVLDICGGEGWDKLASFLGVAAPAVPFPWHNRLPDESS